MGYNKLHDHLHVGRKSMQGARSNNYEKKQAEYNNFVWRSLHSWRNRSNINTYPEFFKPVWYYTDIAPLFETFRPIYRTTKDHKNNSSFDNSIWIFKTQKMGLLVNGRH